MKTQSFSPSSSSSVCIRTSSFVFFSLFSYSFVQEETFAVIRSNPMHNHERENERERGKERDYNLLLSYRSDEPNLLEASNIFFNDVVRYTSQTR